ncbi:hypothetical protein CARUB_v10008133mg [Capsella rubella]|uniref:Uncharacterized protein n=1 Tax=Capsella rubella TaxID=81985 RepID=R0GLE1_9BRAS|nr:hypothetical protein CARUB_v10008133mg [Capsella rubella]
MIIPITLSFIVFYIYASEDVLAASTRDLCRPEQRDALLKFRNEFEIGKRNPYCEMYGIESHRTESWTSNSDCCSWKGIACNANSGEVAELDLSCSFLHGQFHSNSVLQNIHSLTTLNLSFNSLTGKIPSSIGNLSNLTSLDLSFNYFSGQIPTSFGNLFHLTYLDLSHNNFSGALPPNITSLSKLSIFKASHNTFTGAIPSSLFTIPSLTFIGLNDNQLSGTLEFGNISPPSNLQDLHIGGNIFKGPIPKSISKLVNLWTLDLSHFDTQGPVDFSIFSHLKSLQVLDLSYLNTTTTIDLYDILSYFKSLSHLDLSGNRVSTTKKSSSSNPPSKLTTLGFSGCSITEFPELLRTQHEMRLLDISSNKIKGHVPGWLWTLPKLEYVNLFNNTFTSFERSKKKQGLSSVWKPSLVHLLGSNNNFTGKIPTFICELRSLKTLDLSENNFNGLIPRCMGNLKSSLSILNLGKNNLSADLPENIFESLRLLDVSHNQLVGKLPRSLSLSNLEVLLVQNNRINDTFPFWLGSLKKLQILILRFNAFHGPIHQASFPQLRIIDISHNHFDGTLQSEYFVKWSAMSSSEKWNSMSSFMTRKACFNLQYTVKKGYCDDSMVLMNTSVELEPVELTLTNYTVIDFSGNKFEGVIPKSISLIEELVVLNLSNNAFTGHIPSSMGNLTALESFDISNNKFRGKIPSFLCALPYLVYIKLSNNNFTGNIPSLRALKTQPSLDISNNKIEGQVPAWLWMLPDVNLSNNTFTSFEKPMKLGLVSVWQPYIMSNFLGSKNNFTGKIPSFICALHHLSILDLSNNNFNGSIPRCMGNLKNTLTDLNLRQNNLSGGLPDNIFESLRSLDVGHNQLVGKLPRSLIRSTTLEILNVESNRLKDIFPVWLSSLQNLQVLVIRSNAFHGPIHQVLFRKLRIIDISYNHFNGTLPSDFFLKWSAMSSLGTEEDTASVNYMGSGNYYQHSLFLMNKGVRMELVRILKIFTAIDFSGNKFEGEIPKSIGVMKELHVLNLSNNAFTGRIPSSMGNLTALESLDVSQNKLSGEIPQELGKLSFLAYMNFSHNKLVGLLPGGNQFQTQNCSSFEDNLGLFGSSLDEICRDIHTQASQQKSETSESEIEDKVVISWITATIGFIPGIFFGFTIGYILVSYKPKWFMNPFG